MSSKTVLFAPPLRNSQVPETLQKWFLTLQNLHPMIEVDTTSGAMTETLPPAGLNAATGQSNQNAEYTFVASGPNALTIEGATGGNIVIMNGVARFKSNGVIWIRIS